MLGNAIYLFTQSTRDNQPSRYCLSYDNWHQLLSLFSLFSTQHEPISESTSTSFELCFIKYGYQKFPCQKISRTFHPPSVEVAKTRELRILAPFIHIGPCHSPDNDEPSPYFTITWPLINPYQLENTHHSLTLLNCEPVNIGRLTTFEKFFTGISYFLF